MTTVAMIFYVILTVLFCPSLAVAHGRKGGLSGKLIVAT